jgi:hypothetical protein
METSPFNVDNGNIPVEVPAPTAKSNVYGVNITYE